MQETISPQVKPPHIALTESRVWLAQGKVQQVANQMQEAIICAKAGLEALGDEYAPLLVEDDTDLKLLIAEGRIQKGYLNEGAELMLRALETRIFLYAELHQEPILE